MVLGLKFSLLLTLLPNFSAIYTLWWDPRASKKTCALIGYQRVQNVFSFESLVDYPKKEKKRNASSLLNTSNNVVTKQFILVIWIKDFLVFLVKRWGHRFVLNENKTKQRSQCERNWPMYSLLKLTLVQECKRMYEVLDNRAWIRILPSSVHDIFYTFKEIIQFKQIYSYPKVDMYHPF